MEKAFSDKNVARIIGALFLVATIAYGSGSAAITDAPVIGALLEFVDVIAVVGIGVLFFPILKRYSVLVARTYLGTRMLEGTLLLVSIVSIFFVGALWYDRAFQIAMLFLGLGSLPFVYVLYQSKLIPRAISVIGFIGYVALLLWSLLELAGYATGFTLFIPGALFEIIFPVWLIAKGFSEPRNVGGERAETVTDK